jgi:hypothetical protein
MMWSLRGAKRAIVAGGCLSMAYTQLTTSPATIQFARSLGASGLHVGILGALPVGLVGVQMLAAIVANRLEYRKPLWFWLSIVQRLIFLPAALGPWLFPEVGDTAWIWILVGLTGLNHTLLHFATPLWLSWMGDYLPHSGLSSFWGLRHSSQQWTASLALLANSLFFFHSGVDVRAAFAGIIVLGAVLGVADILLFIKVHEPRVMPVVGQRLAAIVLAPFRDPNYRTFVRFSCFWYLASMVGAPFISMYLLEYVGMDLFHVLLLWTISWLGGALSAKYLGTVIEEYGQRPVLVLCASCKTINMLALLSCPADPLGAFWYLIPSFMVDALLNAGITIANNGYMLKNSPRENRTMFIAAGLGFAGMIGGVTSILAGIGLELTKEWSLDLAGLHVVNFHVLFTISVLLRAYAGVLARTIREPKSSSARYVLEQIVFAARIRVRSGRLFLLGRERRVTLDTEEESSEPAVLFQDDDSEIRRAA